MDPGWRAKVEDEQFGLDLVHNILSLAGLKDSEIQGLGFEGATCCVHIEKRSMMIS